MCSVYPTNNMEIGPVYTRCKLETFGSLQGEDSCNFKLPELSEYI